MPALRKLRRPPYETVLLVAIVGLALLLSYACERVGRRVLPRRVVVTDTIRVHIVVDTVVRPDGTTVERITTTTAP